MDYALNVLTCLAMGIGDPPSHDATTTTATNISSSPNATTTTIFAKPLYIVSRTAWLAQDTNGVPKKLYQPVPWVIITHTASESCLKQSQCIFLVRIIQSFHIESRGWNDIGYNFLIGGDGSVYIGRGWDNQGAHTSGYNKKSIGIAFIGTYNQNSPTDKQVEACKSLIQQGVEQGKLSKDYKLFGQRQLASTSSPGDKVFDVIQKWPHFERT